MYILNTLLGYFIALIIDVLSRDKASSSSPVHFRLDFFLRDNRIRLIFSFLLSILIMLAIHFNYGIVGEALGKEGLKLNDLWYFAVGACPDLIVGLAKRYFGFLQPNVVKGYERK